MRPRRPASRESHKDKVFFVAEFAKNFDFSRDNQAHERLGDFRYANPSDTPATLFGRLQHFSIEKPFDSGCGRWESNR